MKIRNTTCFDMADLLRRAVAEYPVEGLEIELRYMRVGAKRCMSGTYYRRCPGYENGLLIRLRINPCNVYPLEAHFKLSQYERKTKRGQTTVYQQLQKLCFKRAEELILAVFLHEFSHYLDHLEGRNGKYKQTKADEFALAGLRKMGMGELFVG